MYTHTIVSFLYFFCHETNMTPCYKFPVPEVLREFYDKQATANQDANAHSAEMAQMKMEGTVGIP